MKFKQVGVVQVSTDTTQGQAWFKKRKKKERKKPEQPATQTQTLRGAGEVGFSQCRLGCAEDSAWFLAEEVTLTM